MDAIAGGIIDPAAAGWLILAAAGPLALLAAFWDLRRMRIPNWLNGALALLFLPLAAVTLPPETILWRVAGAALVLAIGLAFFAIRKMGGGDVKMLAAAALYIPAEQAGMALQLLSLTLIIGLGAVLMTRKALSDPENSWRSLRPGARFPMGVSIGAALIAHLALAAGMAA